MTAKNLLVELFVEELPPKALKKLGEAFSAALANSLKKDGLTGDNAAVTAYASPRRLAAHVTGVLAVAADKPVVQKLMPVAVGLDDEGPALVVALDLLHHFTRERFITRQDSRLVLGRQFFGLQGFAMMQATQYVHEACAVGGGSGIFGGGGFLGRHVAFGCKCWMGKS